MRSIQFVRLLGLFVTLILGTQLSHAQQKGDSTSGWSTLISAKTLHDRLEHPNLLVIDARSSKEVYGGTRAWSD